MEAVGLGIGVAGLTGLMTTGREAKEIFDSYKNASFESQPFLNQRDAAQIILQQWCESVGYGDDRLEERHHPTLDDAKVRGVVDNIVKCIRESLNIDANAGSEPLDGVSSLGRQELRQQGPRGRAKGPVSLEKYRETISRKARLAWAFQEKNKVSYETQNVMALLQLLRDLVPPSGSHSSGSIGAGLAPEFDKALSSLVQHLATVDKERRDDEFKRQLPQWLGTISSTAMYDNFAQKRLEGTCDWILQRHEFQDWAKPISIDTKSLWVHGPAGYGKTILCTKIIEHLQASNSLVAHHFFSSESDNRADPFIIIRAWSHDMIAQNKEAFELGCARWEASDRRPASLTDIKELFKAVIHGVPDCVFVVDGLDECAGIGSDWKASYRESLMAFFMFLKQSTLTSKPIRLVIVSRDEPEIQAGFQIQVGARWEFFDCSMGPGDVKDDATRFARSIVSQRLQNKSELQQDELSSRIVSRFESMFLGIRILEGQLRSGKSQGSLYRTIDQAPTRLNDLYDRNWKRIASLLEPDRGRAFAILRWVTFALRPMTIAELTEALLLAEDGCEALSEEELPDVIDQDYIQSEIIGLCGPLVETRGAVAELASLTVHLSHFSVKQYILCHELVPAGQLISHERLQSRHEARENNFLAISCLRYLNFDSVWKETATKAKTGAIQAFREYATTSWHQHVKQDGDNEREVASYVNAFFHIKNENWEHWRRRAETSFNDDMSQYKGENQVEGRLFYAALLGLMGTMTYLLDEIGLLVNDADSSKRTALLAASSTGWIPGVMYLIQRGACPNKPSNESINPFFVACMKGHTHIVKIFLEKGADLAFRAKSGVTPLMIASGCGHSEVVDLLLEKGADLTVVDEDGWTPLSAASYYGHLEVIQLLLEKGADLTIANKDGWTPLNLASNSGHLEVVRLLLDKGADLNIPNANGWTPLNSASNSGHLEVIRLLLDKGADLDILSNDGWTPLNLASNSGHLEVVRLLLDNGADLDIPSNDGWTPLDLASNSGHLEVVRLLLDKGADLNIPNANGWTPLNSASNSGHLEVVRLLLDKGADLNIPNANGWTPLNSASNSGHLEVVRLLLDKGADLDILSKDGWTPLNLASNSGRLEVVRLLLDKGADLNIPNANGWTPLNSASNSGYLEVIRLLLDKGADLDILSNDGWTPLNLASDSGHLEIVRLLLDKGADLDIPSNDGWTPLNLASNSGRLEVVRLLLDKGADLDILSNNGWTPLNLASNSGHLEVVRLLLDKGADLDILSNDRWTPLNLASNSGHLEVVRLLLDKGADLNIPNANGWTPLNSASDNGHLEVVRLLLDKGADLDILSNDRWTPLNSASDSGHLEVVRLLLDKGADLDIPSNDGWTPLNSASDSGHLEVVRLLLDNGADLDIPSNDGWTPLNSASDSGHLEVVRLLLDKGADLDILSNDGWTSLNLASDSGHLEIVRLLLDKGADLDIPSNDGWTPLNSASNSGHLEVVRLLLDKGADLGIPTNDGWTSLNSASNGGHLEVVRLLLDKGADLDIPNANGYTSLNSASNRGHLEIVRLLLNKGADLDIPNANGYTSLNSASDSGHLEVVKVLLGKGADMTTEIQHGLTPIISASIRGHLEVVRVLCENSHSWSCSQDNNGRTALFHAARCGHYMVVQLLTEQKPELLQIRDRYGSTPLCTAVRNGQANIVKLLLSNSCAKIEDLDGFGRPLIWWARSSGNSQVIAHVLHHFESDEVIQHSDETQLNKSAAESQLSLAWCDICTLFIPDATPYYICNFCDGGDFVICLECSNIGMKCRNESHECVLCKRD